MEVKTFLVSSKSRKPQNMLSKDQFRELIADAYEHLYDLVYLRSHSLTEVLVPQLDSRKERAWELHHLLIGVVEDIEQGPEPPTFSREWRRNRLLVMRYIDGADPKEVAADLAISRRHYYRERDAALEALSAILWNRYVTDSNSTPAFGVSPPDSGSTVGAASNRLEMLRLEMARFAQAERYAQLSEAFEQATRLLKRLLEENDLKLEPVFPVGLPAVSVSKALLHQVLMGMMGYLMQHTQHATIRLSAESDDAAIHLWMRVEPKSPVLGEKPSSDQQAVSQVEELAELAGIHVEAIKEKGVVVGFDVMLPAGSRRTVLAIDDNPDVLELIKRHLEPQGYRVATVQSASELMRLAQRLRPFAIMLDLMMPEQDGWDLLQALLHHRDTQNVPILVCSVLRQKELALSLGATAFVQKPFTEQSLLSALETLETT
jgi:CheY-like chemotaxis protein